MRAPHSLNAVQLAVVSGASRGIGLGFTSQLLRRTTGTVIATSRAAEESPGLKELQSQWPGRLVAMNCDVTDTADVKGVAARIKKEHGGRVDLLLNVAGLLHDQSTGLAPERSISKFDADMAMRVMALNAIGPVVMTQGISPMLSKGAVIGNLSARVGSISDNRM